MFVLAVLTTACGGGPTSLIFDRLELCTSEQGPTDGLCGVHEVFEDRVAAVGRKIPLNIVVLPAYSADAAPDPVFFLAGGPGQGAASIADKIDGMFDQIRKTRDVVLVDQRGTGDSNRLDCEPYDEDDPPPPDLLISEEKVRECLESYDADVRLYTTPIAMDDLNEVRQWLGYDRINLYGGSYGTRAALVYLRRHEPTVRSIVLDGVAPPDMLLPLHMPRDFERALKLVFANCEDDPACSRRFPNARDDLTALLERLGADSLELRLEHPRTGRPREERVSSRGVMMTLSGALYSPWSSALIPLVVERAAEGDYAPLAAMGSIGGGAADSMAQGMFYSVTCSEDYPRLDAEMVARESAGTRIGAALYEIRWGPCKYWPRGEIEPSYYEPVRSDVPVLILSGELDPVTPPRWGEHVKAHLSSSRHLVVPGTGHGVGPVGCGMRLVDQFYQQTQAADLDASCLERLTRPPFFVSNTGPYAGDDPVDENRPESQQ